jgi:hypothetical protein
VHGTHLRIKEVISSRKINVAFMHPQSFGFTPFYNGDSIEFIRAKSLFPFGTNVIKNVLQLSPKEFELTLKNEVPKNIERKDVVENITWTPNVSISNTTIKNIPTRGILVTTRGKVVIENNTFLKTHMSGILISDDANSWYESGYVKDVTIRNNEFVFCGAPVIKVHPENSESVNGHAVHHNINISNNNFKLNKGLLLSAKSTNIIKLTDNIIEADKKLKINKLVNLKACDNAEIKGNKIIKTGVNE